MAASLSSIPPSASTHSLGPPPKDPSAAVGGRLRSNSAYTRPTSPGPASLGSRTMQPDQLYHPQPQTNAPSSAMVNSYGGAVAVEQQHTIRPPHSPHSAEQAMQAAIASTPPPRLYRSQQRSPTSRSPASTMQTEPTIKLIQKAIEHSRDGGETLDLSRGRIERITDEDVEIFRTKVGRDNKGVWRLALSYNALRDGCISPSFASLSRLRYLNLKGNHLTSVPAPICNMHGLEILDLSKNQIAALPEAPGRLALLKVLSLSNNRLASLPTYLVEFTNLKVFKVDHNPIQWPPRDILGPLIDVEPPGRKAVAANEGGEQKTRREEDLRPWIEGMKIWLQEQITDGNPEPRRLHTDEVEGFQLVNGSEVIPSSASAETSHEAMWAPPGPSQITMKRIVPPSEPAQAPSPTKPSFRQRNRAATTSDDSLVHVNASSLSLPAQGIRHDRSISSSSSLTPPISASTSSSHSGPPSAGLPKLPPPVPTAYPPVPGHNRGGSYTVPNRSGNLTAKKSLPDLRKSHAKIIEERRKDSTEVGRSPLDLGYNRSQHQSRRLSPTDEKSVPLKAMASADVMRRTKESAVRDQRAPDTPSLDESRNSYFRRLSMLPPSTISKAVSPSMLMFIDAVRGLFFALTQLHSALREYVNFAVSDRVAGVFARVLEPAGKYMSNLINALDRFDSTSRRSAPPVAAMRGVVDAAKESIAVFGKIVAVLRFQTPAFRDADVRYTRQLLMNVYGGMAEIAQSWKMMAPLLVEIRPILHPESRGLAPPMAKSNSVSGGRTPISPIPESGESQSPERVFRPLPVPPGQSQIANVHLASSMPPVGSSPRGKSRRHAGSFSTEDVERGMMMGTPVAPSRTDWPDLSRTIFEDNEVAEATAPPPFPLHAEPEPPHMTPPQGPQRESLPPIVTSFSQPPRSRHAAMSSAGSSFLYAPNLGQRSLSVDIRPPTPASATLFDEDLLDQVETATDVAFTVWLRLAEDIGASSQQFTHGKDDSISSTNSALHPEGHRNGRLPSRQYNELVSNLSIAEQVTTTLRESLMGLRANPFAYTSLPDNAQAFIKIVVKVLELVKLVSGVHSFSVPVRQALSVLTQATRECAILIQVSSLRPSPAAASNTSLVTEYKDYSKPDFTLGAMSSNEDLPSSGLRGLHLPRQQQIKDRQPALSPLYGR